MYFWYFRRWKADVEEQLFHPLPICTNQDDASLFFMFAEFSITYVVAAIKVENASPSLEYLLYVVSWDCCIKGLNKFLLPLNICCMLYLEIIAINFFYIYDNVSAWFVQLVMNFQSTSFKGTSFLCQLCRCASSFQCNFLIPCTLKHLCNDIICLILLPSVSQ